MKLRMLNPFPILATHLSNSLLLLYSMIFCLPKGFLTCAHASILWQRPYQSLWARSRTARGIITMNGIHNRLNCCLMFIVYTSFTNVVAGHIIQPDRRRRPASPHGNLCKHFLFRLISNTSPIDIGVGPNFDKLTILLP
jgi:hypothetical protein